MSVRVRLAPSPTGSLHLGTARTALFNWLFAKSQNGKFLIRIEDTDKERSKTEHTENILEGLEWLGISWDEDPFIQSESIDSHKSAIKFLLENGLAYRCYATESELEEMRAKQATEGKAPRYDNRHRNLSATEEEDFVQKGREAVIRFRIDDDALITWKDLIRGEVNWRGGDLGGDMVIARRAPANQIGDPLYNLAVVVDDSNMQISHVIRGEDHIANTAKQILLCEALNLNRPYFAHTPLILNSEGRKLSKRDGVTSISDFKEMGYASEAIANYMTLLGWSVPEGISEIFTLFQAIDMFKLSKVNKAGAKFDWDKLNWINSQVIHNWPDHHLLENLKPIWEKQGWDIKEEDWAIELIQLISPSMTLITDGIKESKPFFEMPPIETDGIKQLQKDGSKEAIEFLIKEISMNPWDGKESSFAKELINLAAKSLNIKKGVVMKSLRVALLGSMQGPDLLTSWSLLAKIGEDKKRLLRCL